MSASDGQPTRIQFAADNDELRPFLDAAARALSEVIANLTHHPQLQQPRRMGKDDFRKLSAQLSDEAWRETELAGEGPLAPVHEELSGWNSPDQTREKIPHLVLAADVVDWVAMLLSEHDEIEYNVELEQV